MPSTIGVVASHRLGPLSTAITIDVGGTLKTDWAVQVDLTASNFDWGSCQSNGYDLVFKNAGGTILPHWRQDWDHAGQTATIWVKVDSIAADDYTEIILYFGGSAVAVDPSVIADTFLLGLDFRNEADVLLGDVSQPSPFLGNQLAAANVPLINDGGTGWRESEVREQSNIVWTGSEYVLLVTGKSSTLNYATTDYQLGLLCTTDLAGTWTEYGEVLPDAEDPYIVVSADGTLYTDGSGWHYVYFERKPAQADIGVARTKNFRTDWEVWNGSAWTTSLATHAIVLARGGSGSWEELFSASPVVVHDGSQFVMLYEGESAAFVDSTGCARSADGITWTKAATNPVSALDVPDDARLIGSTWYVLGHGGGGDQYRYTTTDAPADWDNASFTADPASYFEADGNSVMLAHGTAAAAKWATYQNGIGGTSLGIRLYQWFGGSGWAASIAPSTNSLWYEKIDATGELVMTPATDSRKSLILRSVATPLTDDFAIVARRRQIAQTDDQLAGIAVGSGAITAFGDRAAYADGYLFELTNPDATIQIRKYTSGAYVDTTNTADATAAEANNWNTHQVSYLASGLLTYELAGTARVSRTDSTHLAASKGLAVVQGNNPTGAGAQSEYEYLFARPYDGTDLASHVGTISAPVNSVAPAITGTPAQYETLTAGTGTWVGALISYAYQWKRDGASIGGATSSTYVLTVTDVGATITVTVTATNPAGSTAATSAGVGPVAAGAILSRAAGWWSPGAAHISGSTLVDGTGNARNMTRSGTGGAITSDGTHYYAPLRGSTADYYTTPDAAAFDAGTGDLTAIVVVTPRVSVANADIWFGKKSGSALGWNMGNQATGELFGNIDDDATALVVATKASASVVGTRKAYAAVSSGTAWFVVVDGVAGTSQTRPTGSISNTAALVINTGSGTGAGLYGDVDFYGAALFVGEALSLADITTVATELLAAAAV